jgi:3-phosphoshikimate 1-carboxyvinyltransferase
VTPMVSRRVEKLSGDITVPGDKSISHRALMIGALAVGETTVTGLLEGEDVIRTAQAMRDLGAEVARDADGTWRIHGRGIGGLSEPLGVIDMGNSGTASRLLIGLVSTHPFTSFFTGDRSLVRRPMGRIITPLKRMGAAFVSHSGDRLPLAVNGTDQPVPIVYELPVPSAQVKSSIILAGLNTPGATTVIELEATRDHTELMLRHFGAQVTVEDIKGGRAITVTGQPELTGRRVVVPADISSAAFAIVAGLLAPNSKVTIRNVGLNKLRDGIVRTLREMGADIATKPLKEEAGEPVADITVSTSALRGVEVPAERAPSMIDEYLIFAVAAAAASGKTKMHGLAELRVKESDRLGAIVRGLTACGVKVEEEGDSLVVHGTGGSVKGGADIETELDHRIAMSFLVLGMIAKEPVRVDDTEMINTSFPGFVRLMQGLGARIEAPNR